MATKKIVPIKQDYAQYYQRLRRLTQQPAFKISGLVSLTILTVAFLGIFAVMPTFQTISELSKKISDSQEAITKMETKIQALAKAVDVYGQAIDSLGAIDLVLPTTVEFERLSWQIQWLTFNNQLEIANGSFEEFPIRDKENAETLSLLEFELAVNGQYQNIKSFIDDLLQIDRLIVIENVIINSKTLRHQIGPITANIKGNAYYLPTGIND